MRPDSYWIDVPSLRLTSWRARVEGDWPDGEIEGWRAEGINVIVSLIEAEATEKPGRPREVSLCHGLDMEFAALPARLR